MGFANYTELKAEIAAWLSRDDVSTSVGGVDSYIDLAEAWMNRNLRARQMVTSAGTLTYSSGVITHPTAWLGWKAVAIMSTPIVPLQIVDEAGALNYDRANVTDVPAKVIVRGDNSILWPTPEDLGAGALYIVRGVYYRKIPALLAAAQITRADALHPGYGFLAENEDFAAACRDAGGVFIGPSPQGIALRRMAHQGISQGRLSGAIRAHQSMHFTLPDDKINPFQYFFSINTYMQIADFQLRHSVHSCCSMVETIQFRPDLFV